MLFRSAAQDANDFVDLLLQDNNLFDNYKAIGSTEPNINYPKAQFIEQHFPSVRNSSTLYEGMTYTLVDKYLKELGKL